MIAKVALTLVLSQFVRSRVSDTDPNSQCLWWIENTVINFAQSADGTSETPGQTEFAAISKSIETWQTQLQSCASLSLVEVAHTQTRRVGFFNGETNENIAVFRMKPCNTTTVPASAACHQTDTCGNDFDCWEHQSQAIAITTTSYNPDTGRIIDSDIEYNAPKFLFTTVDSPPCQSGNYNSSCVATDIQNTTTHELGHLLGLAHINNASSTMNPNATAGETSKRVLDPGTADFVCRVYPKGQAAKTCLIKPVPLVLGKAIGCSSVPALFPLLALAALLRRRRA